MLTSWGQHAVPHLPDHCEPASQFLVFISSWLHICLPTPLALISSILGSLSLVSWLFAQLPQIIKNFRLKSTAGLSPFFLLEWCLGDTANLIGAILTRQAGWQVVTATYYVFVDVVLVFQYFWYTSCVQFRKGKEGLDNIDHMGGGYGAIIEGISPSETASVTNLSLVHSCEPKDVPFRKGPSFDLPGRQSPSFSNGEKLGSSGRFTYRPGSGTTSLTPQKVVLLTLMMCTVAASAPPTSPFSDSSKTPEPASQVAGRILSWTSTIFYLGSRIPQLYKNYCRKSTTGLSPLLFGAAFGGNFFYSTSLLTNPNAWHNFPPYGGGGWADERGNNRWEWMGRTMPFFLGAAGVLSLDASMGVQFWVYGEKGGRPVVGMEAPSGVSGRLGNLTRQMRKLVIPRGHDQKTGSEDVQALLPQEHPGYGSV